jgi:hypothetical protein
MRILAVFIGFLAFFPTSVFAECYLDQFVGYTLLAKKTIKGFIQEGVENDEFSGCDYDRIIVFDDRTGVACDGYSYSFSYRPDAYIWSNGSSMKMCVGSSIYSVKQIH